MINKMSRGLATETTHWSFSVHTATSENCMDEDYANPRLGSISRDEIVEQEIMITNQTVRFTIFNTLWGVRE